MAPASSSTTPNFSRPLPSPYSARTALTPALTPTSAQGPSGGQGYPDQPHSAPAGMMMAGQPGQRFYANVLTDADFPQKGRQNNEVPKKTSLPTTSGARPSSSHTRPSGDLGVPGKPIVNFRPEIWRHLDRARVALNLDLFWPVKIEELDEDEQEINEDGDTQGVFPFKELVPLQTFRNLRHLQLNGMMRSYQPIIWATCWLNVNLTHVHLEMALEPVINPEREHKYRKIDGKWAYHLDAWPDTEYMGSHGKGTLHDEFGVGEYLDHQAMNRAQVVNVRNLPIENYRYFPTTHLTLVNFAVDSGPFFRWFDPSKLQELNFLGKCVDTGFYLPVEMRSTTRVNGPKNFRPQRPAVARVVKPGEVKLINLKGGKVVPAEEPQGGHGLKSKLSQMLPRLGGGARGKGKEKEKRDSDKEFETAQLERNLANIGL